jgi:hypothetical protein
LSVCNYKCDLAARNLEICHCSESMY